MRSVGSRASCAMLLGSDSVDERSQLPTTAVDVEVCVDRGVCGQPLEVQEHIHTLLLCEREGAVKPVM